MRGLSAIACVIAALTAQSLPSAAQEDILFNPQPTSTGGFSQLFGSWNVVDLEDDDFTGGIFVRCITDRPDFLVVVDRKKAVLNGDRANIRIRADGQIERQFYGTLYGHRFIQLDDPVSAMAALANAKTFIVGIDVSGVQSVLNFTSTSFPMRALANVMSQCQVPVSAKGK